MTINAKYHVEAAHSVASCSVRSYTLKEAVELIGSNSVSVKTLRRAVQSGELQAFRLTPGHNSKILVTEADLRQWIDAAMECGVVRACPRGEVRND